MKKPFVFFLFSITCMNVIYAQQHPGYEKLGATLKLLLSDEKAHSRFLINKDHKKMLSVFIETNLPSDALILKKQGYSLRTVMGTVSTADIDKDNIYNLAAMGAVKRIELPLLLRKTDTIMRKFTTVKQVLRGQAPLDRPYTGKNILIGIIDDGVDISHPDFYDENGKIRIKYLWNMDVDSPLPPQGFAYGREWTADSLEYYGKLFNEKKIGIYPIQLLVGYSNHGTSVTSLAAGNSGVATDAEIVSVALTATADTLLRSDRVIDGIAYIYRKAVEENKKCIINISLGVMDGGPHDGKTLLEQAIDNFCFEHADLLVCTSAGNTGNDWKHWGGFPINKDSSFGFFTCVSKASLYFSIPKKDSKTLNISIGESRFGSYASPNISRDSVFYQSPFLNIDSLINSPSPAVFKSYFPNGGLASDISFAASHYNEDYDELIVTPYEHTSTNTFIDEHLYRFILKGTGTLHAWFPFLNLHPLFFFDNNPYPNDSTYHNTDNDFSTVIPTNAFTVLSSGAYNLRRCYVNMQNEVVSQYEGCRVTYFTSHGPTLDGRIKPDIISPGENVFAARSRFNDYYNYYAIIDTNTIAFGGTSASSPITAGVAALIWEQHPEYKRNDIIQLIKSSANFDSYCGAWGNQPNNISGWGKVDAFNALANVRIDNDGLCHTEDYCITRPDPPAPVVYANGLKIFPNPVNNIATIQYTADKAINYFIFDALGRLMKKALLPAATNATIILDMQTYAKGIYFIKVTGWGKPLVKKIIVGGK